jgi:hypothetical protein
VQPATVNIETSGDFAQANDCPAVLASASFCTISISYTPISSGPGFGQLSVTHDQINETVFLGGSGSASAIVTSTTAVGFGNQFIGQNPLARIVDFSNTTPYPAT